PSQVLTTGRFDLDHTGAPHGQQERAVGPVVDLPKVYDSDSRQRVVGAVHRVPFMTSIANPEEILEPELPIIDPHHHLWDGTPLVPGSGTYLLKEFLADIDTGH